MMTQRIIPLQLPSHATIRTRRLRQTRTLIPLLASLLVVALSLTPVVTADEDDEEDDSNNSGTAYFYNGSDDGTCKVYDSHDFFTIFVQLILAAAAVGSLWVKRLREHPRRTLSTWFLDVSKQGLGAGYAHVLNMLIAGTIVNNTRTGGDGTATTVLEDECAWYGMSYLLDTTLGLLLAVIGLQWLERVSKARHWTALEHSGVYTGDTALNHWSAQVAAWIGILTIVKIMIYAFIWVCSEPLATIGALLFAPFSGYKHLELIFVMIVFPGVMNVIYFWIADSYLQAAADQTEAHEHDETSLTDKKESLLDQSSTNPYPAPAPSWSMLSSAGLTQKQQYQQHDSSVTTASV